MIRAFDAPLLRPLCLIVAAAPLLLAGCRDEAETEGDAARHRSPTGAVARSEQAAGDPEKGYDALVNEPYVSCGIPWSAYSRLNPDPGLSVPGRTGRNAELPYASTAHVNADGVEIVSGNCLICHANRIGDEVIVGLGNEFADFTRDPRRLALQAANYVRGAPETAAWQHWADRVEGIGPYVQTRTVGVNPAPNLTWALMAHLDPETLAWSQEPLIAPPPEDPIPISVPPWWGMRKKNAMFYTTIGRGDHARFMLLASMLCIESPEEAEAIAGYAEDIRAYITSLDAPDYPYPVDETLAARGAEIFQRDCAACHGTYGEDETYPNLVIPYEEVGTDPTYAVEQTDGSRDRFYDWVARSPYGDDQSAAPAPGYIAPPLDGVWATAPYLHNGSVPNMAALLSSSLRPTFWRHRTDPRRYDPEVMGWAHEVLDTGQEEETDPDARRLIYDTTLRGYANTGHSYSDDLDDASVQALIEYLKTL
ncbi:c-type cytochrome [Marinibacterium profundimaris]|uniref:Cytochrome c domain-containing protein n=1 Tax=Marinibacterium profundimaris TaxID=1679460 RepID=A0A225NLT9_9RHOB|nr:c-type cytochrome [Marinibacterium profundimaris]OWU75037.1 hypothetical protein ATO3_10910 [Marinibacterium profundimaris]